MSPSPGNRAALALPMLCSVLFLVAAVSAMPKGARQDPKSSVEERASRLAHAGRNEEAIQLLEADLADHPEALNARLALADLYLRNSRRSEAEQQLREALRIHPDSAAAVVALGTFYFETGSPGAAEQVLNDGVRAHPKLTEMRTLLTLVLASEHKYSEAMASLHLIQPPADPTARVRYYRLAASIHSGLGDKHGAAHAMELALQTTPSDPEMQAVTALAEADAGEWSACIRHATLSFGARPTPDSGLLLLRAQLAAHEDFAGTLQKLNALDLRDDQKLAVRIRSAELLATSEKHAAAVEELQEAMKLSGGADDALLYNLAVEQYGAGQFEKAAATLESLRSKNDSAEIEDLLGDTEENRGNSAAAIESHRKAIGLAPGEERYRLSLGAELLLFGSFTEAVSVFQDAAQLFPESSRVYAGLGMAYYFTEKYDDSVPAFLRADKLDGGSGRAIGYLGATQLNSAEGPVPAAITATCSRADSKPARSDAESWCGALLFRSAYLAGDQAGAAEAIRRLRIAVKLSPDDPVANCSLGQALQWTEQLADARRSLETCVRLRPNSAEDHYRLSHVYLALGLKQAAAEQARLTEQASAGHDFGHAIANKFIREIIDQPKHTEDRK